MLWGAYAQKKGRHRGYEQALCSGSAAPFAIVGPPGIFRLPALFAGERISREQGRIPGRLV